MRRHGKQQLLLGDTTSIIANANEIDSTFFDREFDTSRTSIDAISSISLTTLAGRSITSPAAILLIILVGS